MAELKTRENDADVGAFIASIEDDRRRADCEEVLAMMGEVAGAPPRMWGKTIVGFGLYHYEYASGRTGDWMRIGFSPRKRNLTLYVMTGFDGHAELMAKLGKYKTGKSCLYVTRLSDVDRDVLRALMQASLEHMRAKYPEGD